MLPRPCSPRTGVRSSPTDRPERHLWLPTLRWLHLMTDNVADVSVLDPPPVRGRRVTARIPWGSLAVLAPFVGFILLFLVWPLVTVVQRSFTPGGEWSTASMRRAVSGVYLDSFQLSFKLSAISALVGGVLGTVMALALRGVTHPRWFRSAIDGWSAVASQMGGIPLAFAFIAALGTQGLVTKLLDGIGIDLIGHGFNVAGFSGWVVVYLYFEIPLMFLVMTPAVEGIKGTWEEAAASIGAANWQFWRYVGLPVLLPSLLAGYVLLFVNAFSAYATAYALSRGAGNLVPLQIRFVLQGNVITGEEDLGYSLVTWTVLLLIVALVTITLLQRRASKWNVR